MRTGYGLAGGSCAVRRGPESSARHALCWTPLVVREGGVGAEQPVDRRYRAGRWFDRTLRRGGRIPRGRNHFHGSDTRRDRGRRRCAVSGCGDRAAAGHGGFRRQFRAAAVRCGRTHRRRHRDSAARPGDRGNPRRGRNPATVRGARVHLGRRNRARTGAPNHRRRGPRVPDPRSAPHGPARRNRPRRRLRPARRGPPRRKTRSRSGPLRRYRHTLRRNLRTPTNRTRRIRSAPRTDRESPDRPPRPTHRLRTALDLRSTPTPIRHTHCRIATPSLRTAHIRRIHREIQTNRIDATRGSVRWLNTTRDRSSPAALSRVSTTSPCTAHNIRGADREHPANWIDATRGSVRRLSTTDRGRTVFVYSVRDIRRAHRKSHASGTGATPSICAIRRRGARWLTSTDGIHTRRPIGATRRRHAIRCGSACWISASHGVCTGRRIGATRWLRATGHRSARWIGTSQRGSAVWSPAAVRRIQRAH